MCLWALYHVLTWKWSNTLSILQWLNIFVLFGRLQCQISLYPSSDLHVLITRFRKGTILSIWLYWKFTQSLERSEFYFLVKFLLIRVYLVFPSTLQYALTTAMFSPGDHMEQERLPDWLYHGWATLNASKILLSDWIGSRLSIYQGFFQVCL